MSPSTSRTGPRAMALAMLSIRPRTRLSTTTISRNSRRTRRSTIVEPTRPAPPVTTARLPSRLTDPPTPRSLPPAHPPDDDFRQDVAEQLHPITGCPVGPESLQNVQPRPAGDTRGACSPAAVEIGRGRHGHRPSSPASAVRWKNVRAGLAQCAPLARIPADAPAPVGAAGGNRPRPRHPGGDLRERPRGSHRPEFVHRLPHAGPARGARAGHPCAPGARRADVPRCDRLRPRPPGVPGLRCGDRGGARRGRRRGGAASCGARLPGRRGPLCDLRTVRGLLFSGGDGGARMSRRLTPARRVAELLPALDAAFPTDLLPVARSFLAATARATGSRSVGN